MTDITALAQSLKAAAEKASNGDWVKESGDGWEACCSANDQANGGFIIAHFVGPDAAENREFVQAANPANVLALVEALEKAQQVDEELCKLLPPGAEYMDPPD
ncbi:ead/Ea22-like family protein, partial [Klebsiella pneumoniae]|nr:ead/Ea22-like family protein [Klebsiella pneumoniae]